MCVSVSVKSIKHIADRFFSKIMTMRKKHSDHLKHKQMCYSYILIKSNSNSLLKLYLDLKGCHGNVCQKITHVRSGCRNNPTPSGVLKKQ